ncbi:protein bric-a-brac 2-like, partial [Amphibalanus amphitrite]|uniref:protein bric-a-brac 2-like n=1 Tax=Amphibalanus amphitrite TaxID=1232801 RepID=UPI001C91D9A0
SLVDVTLSCEGQSLKAHKLVLSACSPYFKTLFQDHSEAHPIVILKDVKFAELRSIIQFMYKGEVEVDQSEIESLIGTAEGLMIRGLAGSRSTVSGLQLRPPTGHDLTPRSEPSSDQERKRPRSEHDSGGGGGEPAPSLPPSGPPTTTSSNGDDGSVIKRPKIEDPGSGSGEENNSVDGMESVSTDRRRDLSTSTCCSTGIQNWNADRGGTARMTRAPRYCSDFFLCALILTYTVRGHIDNDTHNTCLYFSTDVALHTKQRNPHKTPTALIAQH